MTRAQAHGFAQEHCFALVYSGAILNLSMPSFPSRKAGSDCHLRRVMSQPRKETVNHSTQLGECLVPGAGLFRSNGVEMWSSAHNRGTIKIK